MCRKANEKISNYNGYLEFEYYDETGTGIGPTLEFYSLFAKEVKKFTNMWYKTSDYTLFPAPINSKNNLEDMKRTSAY